MASQGVLLTVFTKDNPKRVQKTLPPFSDMRYPTILIDDSIHKENVRLNKQLCEEVGLLYHGNEEQDEFLQRLGDERVDDFIAKLGTSGWTLGKARNYAILLGAALDIEKLVLVDDDIKMDGSLELPHLVETLDNFNIVGAYIDNMPDHSVVGYLLRSAGLFQDCFVSGSFVGLHQPSIQNFFLNEYNEDWIWIFMEMGGEKPPKIGSVHQLTYDPYEEAVSTAISQEFGEVLLNGVFTTEGQEMEHRLTNVEFWRTVQTKRETELKRYKQVPVPEYLQATKETVFQAALDELATTRPEEFASVFERYFDQLERWQQILGDVRTNRFQDESLN